MRDDRSQTGSRASRFCRFGVFCARFCELLVINGVKMGKGEIGLAQWAGFGFEVMDIIPVS
jgi:hypothetical protein